MKKKYLLLLTALVLCFALCACGKDYDSRLFNFFGETFQWDMNLTEGKWFIQDSQTKEAAVTVESSSSYTIVSDGTYILRFSTAGDLEFLKIKVSGHKSMLKAITAQYGEPDEEKEVGSSPFYYWYGTMDGRPTRMTLETGGSNDTCYIGLYPDD